jgi:TonB-dependent SusC/RagA subfamily outer membrane receptor
MARRTLARRLHTAALAMALGAAAACGSARKGPAPEPDDAPPAEAEGATARPSTATRRDFGDRRVTRAEELLEGRFPGVEVRRLPNGGIAVRIRGTTSVQGSNEPLYVLDGMPIEPGPGGALVGINPADIARIEVLKDIGSTAQYGVRGANGVILITTRDQ